jgi:hypothetical protein
MRHIDPTSPLLHFLALRGVSAPGDFGGKP